jgi:hypothetical protein
MAPAAVATTRLTVAANLRRAKKPDAKVYVSHDPTG